MMVTAYTPMGYIRYGTVMDDAADGDWPGKDQQRLLQQLDRMVSAGRISLQEAERLRAAGNADEFEAAMGDVRARHAGADLDVAVADGQLTQPEADDLLHRLRRGEHAPGLRKNLRQWRKLHRRSPDEPDPGGPWSHGAG